MFSLISGIWRWLRSKRELRFLILGVDNAGKTTTLEQLKRIYPTNTPKVPLNKIVPTIGLNLCHVDFDRSTSGVFWDLGGQLMLRGIWENHYNECDGVIFVIDSTDVNRFDEVKTTLNNILNHPILMNRDVGISILLNKQDDVEHALSVDSILQAIGILHNQSVIISYTSPDADPTASSKPLTTSSESTGPSISCVSACSAINNINIKPAIDCLVNEIKRISRLGISNGIP